MRSFDSKYSLYFHFFVLFHVVTWTILPSLFRFNLPLDTIEAVAWGYEFDFGYLKHPPLSGWMAGLMMKIFPLQMWSMYFLSQICIAVTFIATWELAKDFLKRDLAFYSVLILEAIYYYNYSSVEFNANIALLPFWSLVSLAAWKVYKNPDSKIWWILLAIFSAFGLYAKYFIAVLFGSIMLMFLSESRLRSQFKKLNPYIFGVIFFALISPHLLWLAQNDFSTFSYIKDRATSEEYHFYYHLTNPLIFVLSQMAVLLLAILVFFGAQKFTFRPSKNEEKVKERFLFFIGIAPILLAIIPSILTGGKMKGMWGSVMFSWFGIALFYFYQPKITQSFKRIYLSSCTFLFVIAAIVFVVGETSRLSKYSHFDSEKFVTEINQKYSAEIKNVAGDVWLASNMNFYAKPRARVVLDLEKFAKEGGILFWNVAYDGDKPNGYFLNPIIQFADVKIQDQIIIPYKKFDKAPYRAGWAIVVPRENGF